MSTMKPRVTSFAPQFLVDDLARSIAYYQKIGFTFGEPWEGFYAIGILDGLELHLRKRPRTTRTGMNPPSSTINSRKNFVVHGHDNEAKESVARFLEKLGLEPIILHEQPSSWSHDYREVRDIFW